MFSRRFFLIVILFGSVLKSESDVDVDRYNEGKRQFELLEYQSEMPQYGQCWIDAMVTIQAGCKKLTDDIQSRLALAYLNCFLELQGLKIYLCNPDTEIRDCTKSLRESDRSSFTTFFTHTQNICYFLQAQIWNKETELTISRLADRSSQLAAQLETSHRLQEDMLDSQSKSLHNQDQLMQSTHTLRGIINSSSNNIRTLFEDLQTSTMEQQQIIRDVFDHLLNLQSTILGEVSGFYSFLFYVLSLSVCYLLTSTARTSGARLWLFLVMTVNFIMEQTVMRWIAGWSTDDERLYRLQWLCRQIFLLVSVAVLSVCAYMYRDVNELNNQLLTEIRKQNSEIKRYISAGQADGPALNNPSVRPSSSTHDHSSDSDYTSDNKSDDNNGSDDSDRTFILQRSRLDDDDSHCTSVHEDSETSSSSLLAELSELRNSTPIREMGNYISSWLNQSQMAENPSDSPPAGHSYNLRRRATNQSTSHYETSPAMKVESPNSFYRTVHHLQQVSEKNSRLLRAEIGQGRLQTATPPSPSLIQLTTRTQALSLPTTRRSHLPQINQHHLTPAGDSY